MASEAGAWGWDGMERIRTLIVDDERPARRRLRELLQREPAIDVVGEGRGGREAVALIRAHRPQLLFLDIQMADLDGFGVLDAIEPAHRPVIVVVTASDRHAHRAVEAQAAACLLKPYSDQRFEAALLRACDCVRARTASALSSTDTTSTRGTKGAS